MGRRPRVGVRVNSGRPVTTASDFDALAMFAAMDARRIQRGPSWPAVAAELWDQSTLLNQRRRDHPISPGCAAAGVGPPHPGR
jgi:hypothetical protein